MKRVLVLLALTMIVSWSSTIAFAAPRYEAGSSKTGDYISEGIIEGGEKGGWSPRNVIESARWGQHAGFERLVFEQNRRSLARFMARVEGQKLIIWWLCDHGSMTDVSQSELIESLYIDSGFKGKGDGGEMIIIAMFKKPVEVEVFVLEKPSRMVIDIREKVD